MHSALWPVLGRGCEGQRRRGCQADGQSSYPTVHFVHDTLLRRCGLSSLRIPSWHQGLLLASRSAYSDLKLSLNFISVLAHTALACGFNLLNSNTKQSGGCYCGIISRIAHSISIDASFGVRVDRYHLNPRSSICSNS